MQGLVTGNYLPHNFTEKEDVKSSGFPAFFLIDPFSG